MTTRRVSVFLDLFGRGYLAEGDKILVKTRAMDSAVDELGDEVDDLSRDLSQVAANADPAARAIDEVGDQARGSAVGVALLSHELQRATRELVALRAAYALTPTVGLASSIVGKKNEIRRLTRLMSSTGALDEGLPGELNLPKLDFSRLVGEARGMLIAGLVYVIAASAPAIGAAIAGAVTGAVGGGGIIGGIAAASMDPRVQAAWRNLGQSIDMEDFAGPAFIRPTLAAITELRDAFDELDLDESLTLVAPYVQIFAKGIADLARNLIPGLNAALAASGPFMVVFAEGLAETGAALGEMLTDMAEDEGAIMGLHALFDLLTGTLRWLGAAVRYLAVTWRFLVTSGEGVAEFFSDATLGASRLLNELQGISLFAPVAGWAFRSMGDRAENARQHFEDWANTVQESGTKAETAREMYERLMREGLDPFPAYLLESQEAAEKANRSVVDLSMSLDTMFNKLMGSQRAEIQFERAMDDLTDSVKEHGKSLDIHTEKGRANVNGLLDQVDAAKAMRDEMIELGRSTDVADAAYHRNLQRIREHAYALGLDKEAVDAIVGRYDVVINFKVQGQFLTGFQLSGKPSFAELESSRLRPVFGTPVPGARARVLRPPSFAEQEVVRQHSYGTGPPPTPLKPRRQHTQTFPGFASGGETPAFAPWRVHRDETVFDSYSSYVATAAQSRAMFGPSGSTGGTLTHILDVRINGRTVRELAIEDARARGVRQDSITVAYP
jgi:hypothetical protein